MKLDEITSALGVGVITLVIVGATALVGGIAGAFTGAVLCEAQGRTGAMMGALGLPPLLGLTTVAVVLLRRKGWLIDA